MAPLSNLQTRAVETLIHPYSNQATIRETGPLVIERGKGVYIYDSEGKQYLEENDTPVAALREGAMLRIENGETLLKGSSGARIFRRGLEPVEMSPGEQIDALLQPSTPTI